MSTIADNLGLATSIVALATAAAASWRVATVWYRRTLGSRRALQDKLWRLGPGVTLRHVDSLLGPPTYRRNATLHGEQGRLPESFVSVYFTRHANVQVVHTEHGEVIGFAVTVTDRKFHPTIRQLPPVVQDQHPVILGRTRFSDIPPAHVQTAWLFRGAQLSKYSELMYVGRPGGYSTFDLSFNPVGTGAFDLSHYREGSGPEGIDRGKEQEWQRFRSGTTINTVGVYASDLSVDHLRESPLRFGIDPDATPNLATPIMRNHPHQLRPRWTRSRTRA